MQHDENRAFVFIKPHANTPQVDALVHEVLQVRGISITTEGTLGAQEIDEKKLIDNHYGAIASKAVLLKPSQLNVPQKGRDQFLSNFGLTWEEAVTSGQVFNAADACVALNVNGDELEKVWRVNEKESLIKFGGGFYCVKLEEDVYVINGFYMKMRDKYTTPPASIRYYEVEWSPAVLPWKAFREEVLGATDPKLAVEGSLRRRIFDDWSVLGLSKQPDVGNNSVHGSASPFEALAEVANWEGKKIDDDAFGRSLLAATNLDVDTLKLWLADAQVPVDGKLTSIFDALEDLDSKDVLEKVQQIVYEI